MDDSIDQVRDWVSAAHAIVVLTGAGISTDSGIPDFRGPNGVWTKNPRAERTAHIQTYLADKEVRRQAWRNRLASPAWGAEPNAAHRALVKLEHRGALDALITQNIDGLHQRAGSDPDRVIELHGTIWWTVCWACGDRREMAETLARVQNGEDDPACLVCGGVLKSATISFGQGLDPDLIQRADAASRRCDLFLALGSTLTVTPAATLVPVAKVSGARVVIVNAERTPYDPIADAVVREPLGVSVPAIVGAGREWRPNG